MPPEKFAYRFSLSLPPFLITLSKDLVVFSTPGGPLIGLPIRSMLKPANLSP